MTKLNAPEDGSIAKKMNWVEVRIFRRQLHRTDRVCQPQKFWMSVIFWYRETSVSWWAPICRRRLFKRNLPFPLRADSRRTIGVNRRWSHDQETSCHNYRVNPTLWWVVSMWCFLGRERPFKWLARLVGEYTILIVVSFFAQTAAYSNVLFPSIEISSSLIFRTI